MGDHRRETAEETAVETPVLVPQQHGGALLSKGRKGNRGGTGRPPSVLRQRMRGSLDARLAIIEEIADDSEVPAVVRLKALEFLARYGLGTQQEHATTEGPLVVRVAGLPVGEGEDRSTNRGSPGRG